MIKLKEEYQVRQYIPGDETKIVQLLELVFDGWPHFDLSCTSLDHWKWKYKDNPLNIKGIAVTVSNDKIIGCLHFAYQKIKVGKKVLLCSQTRDAAVHPDYRRKGVYTKMTRLLNELREKVNTRFGYGISANPIINREQIKMGLPRFPNPVLELIRIQNIDLHLLKKNSKKVWLKKYGYHIYKLFNNMKNTFKISHIPYSSYLNISEINYFDDRIDLFWDEIKDHYNFLMVGSRVYLNWRYCDPRGGKYLVKIVEEDNKVLGYSVLRANRYRKEYPEGYIIDFLTLPNRLDVANALIEDILMHCNDLDINIIHYWVIKNHPYEKLFNLYGFLDRRLKLEIFYKNVDNRNNLEDFKKATSKSMYFQYGYVDAI